MSTLTTFLGRRTDDAFAEQVEGLLVEPSVAPRETRPTA